MASKSCFSSRLILILSFAENKIQLPYGCSEIILKLQQVLRAGSYLSTRSLCSLPLVLRCALSSSSFSAQLTASFPICSPPNEDERRLFSHLGKAIRIARKRFLSQLSTFTEFLRIFSGFEVALLSSQPPQRGHRTGRKNRKSHGVLLIDRISCSGRGERGGGSDVGVELGRCVWPFGLSKLSSAKRGNGKLEQFTNNFSDPVREAAPSLCGSGESCEKRSRC